MSKPVVIEMPQCTPGIGNLIAWPESRKLIAGVRALLYAQWPDDLGYFLEIARVGQGLVEGHRNGPGDTALCNLLPAV